MTVITKTLNLGKLDFLHLLTGEGLNISSSLEYFHLGYPIKTPPSLRGSIIVCFNHKLLTFNRESFVTGSPIDNGSIEFGFIKVNCDIKSFMKQSNCDYDKFSHLARRISDSNKIIRYSIYNHRRTPSFRNILQNYFEPEVVTAMFEDENPHRWIFEFSLKNGFIFENEFLEHMYIPNTYMSNPVIKKIVFNMKNKVRFYNPKYGIEGITYEG